MNGNFALLQANLIIMTHRIVQKNFLRLKSVMKIPFTNISMNRPVTLSLLRLVSPANCMHMENY